MLQDMTRPASAPCKRMHAGPLHCAYVLLTSAASRAPQVLPDNAFDRMHHSLAGEPSCSAADVAELNTFANPVREGVQARHRPCCWLACWLCVLAWLLHWQPTSHPCHQQLHMPYDVL